MLLNRAAKATLAINTGISENEGLSSDAPFYDLDEKVDGTSSAKGNAGVGFSQK